MGNLIQIMISLQLKYVPYETKTETPNIHIYNCGRANITMENVEKLSQEIESTKRGIWYELQALNTKTGEKT